MQHTNRDKSESGRVRTASSRSSRGNRPWDELNAGLRKGRRGWKMPELVIIVECFGTGDAWNTERILMFPRLHGEFFLVSFFFFYVPVLLSCTPQSLFRFLSLVSFFLVLHRYIFFPCLFFLSCSLHFASAPFKAVPCTPEFHYGAGYLGRSREIGDKRK